MHDILFHRKYKYEVNHGPNTLQQNRDDQRTSEDTKKIRQSIASFHKSASNNLDVSNNWSCEEPEAQKRVQVSFPLMHNAQEGVSACEKCGDGSKMWRFFLWILLGSVTSLKHQENLESGYICQVTPKMVFWPKKRDIKIIIHMIYYLLKIVICNLRIIQDYYINVTRLFFVTFELLVLSKSYN